MNQPPGRRQFLGGLAAALTVGGLTACSTPGPARPAAPRKRYGGNLVAGLTGGSSADTLDPHQGLSYPDTARAQALYEPLVQLSADASRIEYVLATEMTPRDTKGTQWVIRLRKGIAFHDGRPLTAADVIYTFRRIITSRYSAAHVLGPDEPAGIKALDPLTVLVPMSRPYTTLPEQLAGILTAQIVPAGYTAKTRPNGTGPFQFTSFTPGQQSVFTRNPHYWQPGLPYAGTLTLIDFPNAISLADALRTGQVHAAGTLDPQQVPDLSTAGGIKVVISQAGTSRVAPVHCCTGAPSGPGMHVPAHHGPGKPLRAVQVVCCITVFSAVRGWFLLRWQVSCTRCVLWLRAALGVSWWTK